MIGRVCYSDSALVSTCSLRSHFLVSSSMASRRLPQHILSQKSPIHRPRLHIVRSLRKVRRNGRTSTISSDFRSQTSTRTTSRQMSLSRTRSRHNLHRARSSLRFPNALYCHSSTVCIKLILTYSLSSAKPFLSTFLRFPYQSSKNAISKLVFLRMRRCGPEIPRMPTCLNRLPGSAFSVRSNRFDV